MFSKCDFAVVGAMPSAVAASAKVRPPRRLASTRTRCSARHAPPDASRIRVQIRQVGTDLGAQLFRTDFTPKQGLGPLYNARSCIECHHTPTAGGMGRNGLSVVHRVGRFDGLEFDDLAGLGGPVARAG